MVVLWAEQDVILHDQFRDGHVPAGCGNARVLDQAVANLPQRITQLRVRADSALSETAVLRWCEDAKIEYAISADLSEPLTAEIVRLPEAAWQLEREEPEAVRAWAEVPYRARRWGPSQGPALRPTLPRGARAEAAGDALRGWEQCPLLRRGNQPARGRARDPPVAPRAGRHRRACPHVLKNELAAAALPSGQFGATAAWFRLNVLTDNLLSALTRLTLPGDLRTARPKRLRFLLFNTVGKVVAHARRTLLRLSGALQHVLLVRARRKIFRLVPA